MSDTYPSPLELGAVDAKNLGGTTHAQTQTAIVEQGLSGASLITKQNNALRNVLILLTGIARGMCRKTGALTIACNPFPYEAADGTPQRYATGAVELTLTPSATNYIYLDHGTGLLAADTSDWPLDRSTYTPLAIYVCDASEILTSDEDADVRGLNFFRAFANPAAPTGTTELEFLLGSDATTAGNRALLMRLTAAISVALKWLNASSRFDLLADEDLGTLAALNLLKIQISGTDMLTSAGAAKVAAAVAGDGLTHTAGVLTPHVDDDTLEVDVTSHELQIKASGAAALLAGDGLDVVGNALVPDCDGTTVEVDSSSKQIQLKAAGVATTHLDATLAGKLGQLSIGDSNGASPRTVTLQVKDAQGNNLAGAALIQVGVYQDVDGAAEATDATLAVGATGSLVRTVTTGKVLICKTDANGTLTVTVTDTVSETVYLLAAPAPGGKALDCRDSGAVTIS